MEKYGLYEYVPLVDGIRKGDLRKFNDTLIQFQHQFIRYVEKQDRTEAWIVNNGSDIVVYFSSL